MARIIFITTEKVMNSVWLTTSYTVYIFLDFYSIYIIHYTVYKLYSIYINIQYIYNIQFTVTLHNIYTVYSTYTVYSIKYTLDITVYSIYTHNYNCHPTSNVFTYIFFPQKIIHWELKTIVLMNRMA